MSKPPPELITPPDTNISGKYRQCEDTLCDTYIMCPYVRCQEHRKDFAMKDNIVTEWKS